MKLLNKQMVAIEGLGMIFLMGGYSLPVNAATATQLQTMAGVIMLADAHSHHRSVRPPHKQPRAHKPMKRENRKGVSGTAGKQKPSASSHNSDVTKMDAEETDEFRPRNRNRAPVENRPAISKMDMEESDEFKPQQKGSLGGNPGSKGISTGL